MTDIKRAIQDLQRAIDVVAKRYPKLGFDLFATDVHADCSTLRLEIGDRGEDGRVWGPNKTMFALQCGIYGLAPSAFNAVFTDNGYQFKVTGLKTQNRSMPLLAERLHDRRPFKFRVSDSIKAQLATPKYAEKTVAERMAEQAREQENKQLNAALKDRAEF